MAVGCVKLCVLRTVASIIGFLFAIFPFILLTLKTLYKGRSVWSVKPRPNPPKCLNDPQYGSHRYMKLKNIRLHYVESGDQTKPLVVFLHGFPEFWYSWRHQIKAFKNSFWTVAVDMRGYGDSDKPTGIKSYDEQLLVDDVKQFVNALGRSSCILVAHDWGGMVAYLTAIRHPQLIEKLIILNCPHPLALKQMRNRSLKQFFKSWYIMFFQMPFLPEVYLAAEDDAIFDKIFRASDEWKKLITDDDIEAFKYTFSSRAKWTPPVNYYRNMLSKGGEFHKSVSAKISIPSLIIWGCNDLALEKGLAELSTQYFTNCDLKYVENGSHFVQQDSAPIVNQLIESFIKTKK